MLAAFYDTFLAKAAEGRKQKPEDIDAVAQGRVWTGRDALSHGLIDRLGGLETAIRSARGRAKIAASEDVSIVVMPAPRTFLEAIMQRSDDDVEVRLPTLELQALARYSRVLGPSGSPVARLPFELKVR
jgi:protease-4